MPAPTPFLRIRVATLAALLVLGTAAACSDDDDAAATATDADLAADTDTDGEAGAREAIADAVGGDDERPFGIDAEGLASAMQSGTGADRVDVDGSTFRLHFAEGSTDDVSAEIDCRAMDMVAGADDTVILVFADGELDCADVVGR